ncbi:MAG: hypothetical protein J7578_01605 [Chitinophagaceae bacterium]|nr:hypothetical protein [Chitinophagaceae bacterium]
MKAFCSLTTVICLLTLFSCKKGDQGEPGIDGNANVVQYNLAAVDLTAPFATLNIPTTADTMNNSAWYVYLHYQSLDRWYLVPGNGVGGTTTYRVSMSYVSPNAVIYIDKTGPGEKYDKARVVRVYSNKQVNLSVNTQVRGISLDFSNYEAIRNYFKLP